MIDARAAILQLRALIQAGEFIDMKAMRRLAIRATSGIADKEQAGELQDRLVREVEYMAMLAEMNDAAGTPAVFRGGPLKVLDEIDLRLG